MVSAVFGLRGRVIEGGLYLARVLIGPDRAPHARFKGRFALSPVTNIERKGRIYQ